MKAYNSEDFSYWELFHRGWVGWGLKGRSLKPITHLPLVLRLRMHGTVPPFLHKTSCREKGQFVFTFTFCQFLYLLLLLEALQLQGSFGLLNEFFPFGPVSDAVPPVCYS